MPPAFLRFYMGKNTPERKDYIMEQPGRAGGGIARGADCRLKISASWPCGLGRV